MTKLTTERKELLVAWDIEYMQAIAAADVQLVRAAAQAKADLLHGAPPPPPPLQHSTGGLGGGGGAQQEREPIRGRPAVRGKRTCGGRPGQRVEEQGTWASQKHSEAGLQTACGRRCVDSKNSQTTPATTSTTPNTPIIGRR